MCCHQWVAGVWMVVLGKSETNKKIEGVVIDIPKPQITMSQMALHAQITMKQHPLTLIVSGDKEKQSFCKATQHK